MHLHIDGDIIVYRAGFAAEKQQWHVMNEGGGIVQTFTTKAEAEARIEELDGPYELGKGDRVAEPVENALWAAKMIMNSIFRGQPEYDAHTVYLSGDSNFRTEVATIKKYKGNRDDAVKPVHTEAIKRYLEKNHPVVYSEGEEADDTIGWSHMRCVREDGPFESVVVSIDKDLDMLPGLHYNFVKEEAYFIDEPFAMYLFYKQMLTGDSTDNIPGVPGIGDKRAAKMLEDVDHREEALHNAVWAAYESAYKADAAAAYKENGRLLWIRREQDEMWKPYNERAEDAVSNTEG